MHPELDFHRWSQDKTARINCCASSVRGALAVLVIVQATAAAAPVPYVPFTVGDLRKGATREVVQGADILIVNGKTQITPQQYVEELNQIEQALTAQGQSLRHPDGVGQLKARFLSHKSLARPSSGASPARESIDPAHWNSGQIGLPHVLTAALSFDSDIVDTDGIRTQSDLVLRMGLFGSQFELARVAVSAFVPKPLDARPPYVSASIVIGQGAPGGGAQFEKNDTNINYSPSVYSRDITPPAVMEIPIWGPIVLKLRAVLTASLRPGIMASASAQTSKVAWSATLGLHARIEALASLRIVDVGAYLDNNILSVGPTVSANATVRKQASSLYADWSRQSSIEFVVESHEVGAEICVDLSYIALGRPCAGVSIGKWDGQSFSLPLGSRGGSYGPLCTYTCKTGSCDVPDGCGGSCGCQAAYECDKTKHVCVRNSPVYCCNVHGKDVYAPSADACRASMLHGECAPSPRPRDN